MLKLLSVFRVLSVLKVLVVVVGKGGMKSPVSEARRPVKLARKSITVTRRACGTVHYDTHHTQTQNREIMGRHFGARGLG